VIPEATSEARTILESRGREFHVDWMSIQLKAMQAMLCIGRIARIFKVLEPIKTRKTETQKHKKKATSSRESIQKPQYQKQEEHTTNPSEVRHGNSSN
jgi:hypothetical protein